MEDRKRSLAADAGDDLAPSRKRLVKDENGQAMRMDGEKERDVENFQKDAIMRQMKEYKRQKKDFEDQYNSLLSKSKFHDEHLRTIDAWFSQLLDEVRILAAQTLPAPSAGQDSENGQDGGDIYGSKLRFEDNELFSAHLQTRSDNIKGAIHDLFGRIPQTQPDVEDLRKQLNDLLAREKDHAIKLRTALEDQESLQERLENASYRYIKAEKMLDRAKSSQVQKLERQAMFGSGAANGGEGSSPAGGKRGGTSTPGVKKEGSESLTNGELENGITSAEVESQRKEAMAVAEKQKAQVEEIEAENERLTNALSAARTKLASLSDDDYAETSLFKSFKAQYESMITKVNDLEATNQTLREEAQKYAADRTRFRQQIDDETRESISESETQIARAETDLARIRNVRDELNAELNIRKTHEENRKLSAEQAKELADARDARIRSLESELQRVKLRLGEVEPTSSAENNANLEPEALKTRNRTLEQQQALLTNELSSMESAWRKTSALASKKVEEITAKEETISRLQAEKAKADQKYFAAMKAKDMRENELRTLKSQSARSSEIVTQLKDSESKTRELVTNLERQLAESQEGLKTLTAQHRTLEAKAKESGIVVEGLRKQIEDLKKTVAEKDREVLAAGKSKREAEIELERTVTRLEDSKKQIDGLRKTRANENSASSDDWRKLAICPVCNANIRNTVIKLCGHVFCQSCVKDLISNRSRKCPSCGKAFGGQDYMGIVLT
ncbi:BRE1-domain-containing protein [Hortaea werneckii]|uniref:E3 ubiquitin protein ligase n=1 Tax=Hortaea werneckii TaxID=91943 RepID=A0A3M7F0B5_HORWE|nr:BRE1-domain-containing protein [Hortaea werneckii]KAI6987551.1 BRE1-domain-containing protein [Hortaea werneckii]KAI7141632.1 BRE1-domain-containing protein [Hortaea werneckii]KAI7168732.1 BRE1-domain-containing protein [Hortaea werneckii]KAI7182604.1 BRE1-domain-containing protein [Hortaea werneckii]